MIPTGYAQAAPVSFSVAADGTITVAGQAADKVVMEDAPLAFKVSKLEATGTQSVIGAEFAVYKASDMDGDTPKDGAVAVDSWTTTNGTSHDCGGKLQAGVSYVLVETKAPTGYGMIAPVSFTVAADGSITTNLEKDAYDTYIVRDAKISVALSKVDFDDTTIGLSGAVIEVYAAEDMGTDDKPLSGAQPVDSWTTVAGESHAFGDKLKAGKRYVVVEKTAPAGYELAENITITVGLDGTVTVGNAEMDNDGVILMKDQSTVAEPGRLIITKTVAGALDKSALEGQLKFTVENADNNTPAYNQTFILGRDTFLWNEALGKYVLEIRDLPVGSYQVTEVLGTTTPDNMSCTTTYIVGGQGTENGSATGAVEVTKDTEITVAYTNTYVKDVVTSKTGKIVITKLLKGKFDRTAAVNAITFTVTNNDTRETKTYKLSEFTYNETTGLYTLELEVVAGGYTVEETVTNVDGYTLSKVTYTVGGSTTEGKKAVVDVPEDGSVTVAYEDTYKKNSKPKKDRGGDEDEDEDPQPDPEPSGTPVVQQVSLTKTGDKTPLALWMAMFVCGFAGMLTDCAVLLRKRREN